MFPRNGWFGYINLLPILSKSCTLFIDLYFIGFFPAPLATLERSANGRSLIILYDAVEMNGNISA